MPQPFWIPFCYFIFPVIGQGLWSDYENPLCANQVTGVKRLLTFPEAHRISKNTAPLHGEGLCSYRLIAVLFRSQGSMLDAQNCLQIIAKFLHALLRARGNRCHILP